MAEKLEEKGIGRNVIKNAGFYLRTLLKIIQISKDTFIYIFFFYKKIIE